MRGLTLTTKEQSRIQVLNGVMEGKVTVAKAAGLMGVSERHAWRLLAAYREEGPSAVAHGNRGRKPATTTCPETQQKVMELAEGPYAGLNHTHDRGAGRPPVVPTVRPASEGSPRRRKAPRPTSGGSATHRRGCAADRWQPPRLAPGPGTLSDPRGCRGRRHRHGPLRPVQTAGRCARLHADIIDQHGVPLALYSPSSAHPKSPRPSPSSFEAGATSVLGHLRSWRFASWPTPPRRRAADGAPSRTGWSLSCLAVSSANQVLAATASDSCRPSQAGLSLSSTPYWGLR